MRIFNLFKFPDFLLKHLDIFLILRHDFNKPVLNFVKLRRHIIIHQIVYLFNSFHLHRALINLFHRLITSVFNPFLRRSSAHLVLVGLRNYLFKLQDRALRASLLILPAFTRIIVVMSYILDNCFCDYFGFAMTMTRTMKTVWGGKFL